MATPTRPMTPVQPAIEGAREEAAPEGEAEAAPLDAEEAAPPTTDWAEERMLPPEADEEAAEPDMEVMEDMDDSPRAAELQVSAFLKS